jgi:hypothetical protein
VLYLQLLQRMGERDLGGVPAQECACEVRSVPEGQARMRAYKCSCGCGCGCAAFQLLTAYQIPKNFCHATNCLAQLVNMARHKARDPGNVPPTEDIERIVKYSKVLLSVISA